MRPPPGLALILLVLLTAASPARADVTDRVTRLIRIAPAATVLVQITVGDVLVNGWDRDEVSVELVRHAPDAGQLARIPAVIEHTADGVVVRAVQVEDGRDPRLRTDVVLRVPAAISLRDLTVFEGRITLADLRGACAARIERGSIEGKRLSGTVRLETTIGHIRLEATTLSPEGVLRLRTFNGDVALELASRPPDARILALSMGGIVTSDIPLNMKTRSGPRFGEATLGKGEPVVSIDVVNGNVAIRVAGAGR